MRDFSEPQAMQSRSEHIPPISHRRPDPFDAAAWLLIAAVLAVALWAVGDYSISNDEEVQHRYGELIVRYYASGFADRTVFDYKNLYLYGGLFDIVAVLLGKIVPGDIYLIRHVLCALTGIGGLIATWATARLIAGPRAGFIALATLAVCGPWFGGMFNHTKDVPFAAAMMGAVYYALRCARACPAPPMRHVLALGVLAGAALGLRAMGLLLGLYALLAVALHAPRPLPAAAMRTFVRPAILRFLPGVLLAYAIMIMSWPWAALHPLNPLHGLFAFAHFHYPIKTLVAGELYLMAGVPRWYVPTYLAIKLPLAMLAGAALATVLAVARPGTVRGRETLLIAFFAAFPVLCEVIAQGPAFSGMRHFMFVVPPLAVLAGIGFDDALERLDALSHAVAYAAAIALGLWLAVTASVLVRLHPYEHLYFNAFVGGLPGASQRYDTDYWVNVMREAVAGLEALVDRENLKDAPDRYFVAVCGERLSFEREAARRGGRLIWATDDMPADFFLAPTHQGCHQALDGRPVVVIERLGVPIGMVLDRRELTGVFCEPVPGREALGPGKSCARQGAGGR